MANSLARQGGGGEWQIEFACVPKSCTKTYQVSDFVVVYVAAAASRPFCALLLSLSLLSSLSLPLLLCTLHS